jgi:triacylglycerol lipase
MARLISLPSPLSVARSVRHSFASNVGSPRYYMGDARDRRDDAGLPGECVLLIQVFFQTRRVMETLEQRLRADGYRVISFHLGGLLGNFNTRGVHTLAAHIERKMERLRERYGIEHVHVIGHSMGGLVARYLVLQGNHDWVRTVITLGSPHHGTPVAALGAGLGLLVVSRGLWQLFPFSGLVRDMKAQPVPASVRLVSVYSTGDLICPYSYSVLTPRDGDDVRNILVKGMGHMGLVEDPWVYGLVLRELKDRPHDSASGPVADIDEEVTRSA